MANIVAHASLQTDLSLTTNPDTIISLTGITSDLNIEPTNVSSISSEIIQQDDTSLYILSLSYTIGNATKDFASSDPFVLLDTIFINQLSAPSGVSVTTIPYPALRPSPRTSVPLSISLQPRDRPLRHPATYLTSWH